MSDSSYPTIIVEPSMELLRSKIPDIVYEAERYLSGEIGDHPDTSEYVIEVQKFFRNCIGLNNSSPTTVKEET